MTSPAGAVAIFFLLLFAYTKLLGPIPFSVNSVTTQKTDLFTVTGEGNAVAAPDLAVVSLGVQTQAATVKQAQEHLNEKINAVSAALKTLGMDKEDIKTTNYTINPTYDYRGGGNTITGYTASSTLTVKVRDLEMVNGAIDAATGKGANTVGGVTFEASNKEKAQNEAREKAVEDAKNKAREAARTAGFRLGKLATYQESFGEPGPIPLYARAEGGERLSAPTQLEPGTTEITLQVTLGYEIE